jgi:hypothetical protein
MSVFTKLTKQRLSWQAPPAITIGLPEVDFLFSDSSDFLFSDDTDYVFFEGSSERVPTAWTLPSKQRLSWPS